MSARREPVRRGTLVCVVLKAKNLPNKRSIGKQDPYCVLQLGPEQQKTKPDKRGGQHPQWDEQLHFEIFDDMEDQLRKNTAESSGTSASKQKEKVKKTMRVTCYADDSKEPEFIGDGVVDLTDTLKTGEFDEWVTIKAKDRYAGEVYLELTFYSSAAPPKPKKPLTHQVPANTTYGGAGTFSEDFDESDFAPRPPNKQPAHASIPSSFLSSSNIASSGQGSNSSSNLQQHSRRTQNMTASKSHSQFGSLGAPDSVPPSLRPSSSMAHIDTYTPPYAPAHIQRERTPGLPSSASDVGVRRDSFPPAGQSASAHFYGHRLPDAVPQSVATQRILDDARRHSQHLSSSSTLHYLPHQQDSSSASTIRPACSNANGTGAGGSVDGLVGSLSSMSIQTSVNVPEGQRGSYQQQYGGPSYGAVQGSIPPSMTVDQFGRPMPIVVSPPTEAAIAHPYVQAAPTQQAPSQYGQHYPLPPSATTQGYQPPPLNAQQQQSYPHFSTSSSPAPAPRPTSPAVGSNTGGPWQQPPPPIRTHTPGGYNTLSLPPPGAGDSQVGAGIQSGGTMPGRSPSPLPHPPSNNDQPAQYNSAASGMPSSATSNVQLTTSTSPPKPAISRPLPSTGASPSQQANAPAPVIPPAQYAQQPLPPTRPTSDSGPYYVPASAHPGPWPPGYNAAPPPLLSHGPSPTSHYIVPPSQYTQQQPGYPSPYPPPPPTESSYQHSTVPPVGNSPSSAQTSHLFHNPPPQPTEYSQYAANTHVTQSQPPPMPPLQQPQPPLYQQQFPNAPPSHLAPHNAPHPPPPGPHPPAPYYQPAYPSQQSQYPY